jgi:probable phosphoglycerate mutase
LLKTLFLIRHGQTAWNLERRMQGRLDSPLTQTGIAQVHAHGRLLKRGSSVAEMIVSPSGRTRETAYILNSYLRAALSYADELLERDLGDWSGLTLDEVGERFPAAFRQRQENPYHFRPPGGENLEDMADRVGSFLDDLLAGEGEEVALVTHQVMSRVILGRLLALEPREIVTLAHPNDVVYRLDFSDGPVCVQHFASGEGPRSGLLRQDRGGTIPRPGVGEIDGLR